MNIAQIEENIKKLVGDLTEGSITQDSFIYELLLAYGHRKQSVSRLRSGERNLSKEANEVIWRRNLYFRQIEGNALHAEIDQIRNEKVIDRYKLRFIIVTNFNQLLAVDTKTSDTLDIELSELPKNFDFFLPWAGMEKAVYQGENPADVKAAEKMAKLFDLIKVDNFDESNREDKGELHNLNVFLTRLLFCFFAEDTEIFTENQFSLAIKSHTNENGSDLSDYLNRLFDVLNTAVDNRKGLPDYLATFPYVNGGLFSDKIQSPAFSAKSRRMLIECGNELDWSDINPDIFGSMIQAVVHPEQRSGMGMHYTSVTNIMKVIEPLFLNDFYDEFEKYENKPKKLQELLQRLGSIKIFDPACGSGNFLIIAYKELRNLEMEILKQLQEIELKKSGQIFQAYSEIKLTQFYGIEIDDFAHEVAILSLWLAEHQMNIEFKTEFGEVKASLPLQKGGNIVCENATSIDWNDVCEKHHSEIYICSNPPYLGQKQQSQKQKKELEEVCGNISGYKKLDYISCWFFKASRYLNDKSAFAFVTTNSVSQGVQVPILWPELLGMCLEISFAYRNFHWSNNAKRNAGVTCSIIGIRFESKNEKYIFNEQSVAQVKHINAYLVDGNDVIVEKKRESISGLPPMVYGNMALDGGHLMLSDQEKNSFLESEPEAAQYIRKTTGSNEFIKGINRWCIWIETNDLKKASKIRFLNERINSCLEFRKSGGDVARTLVDRPHQFRYRHTPTKSQIIIPLVSSERRRYIPIGYVDKNTIIQQTAQVIYDAEPYIFGIINSYMHMVWVRALCGRTRTDLQYSNTLCYNTFPIDAPSEESKEELSHLSMEIIAAREKFSHKSYSDLYDPDIMPLELVDAHKNLDKYVDSLYRKEPFASDNDRLPFLLEKYEKMIGKDNA